MAPNPVLGPRWVHVVAAPPLTWICSLSFHKWHWLWHLIIAHCSPLLREVLPPRDLIKSLEMSTPGEEGRQ